MTTQSDMEGGQPNSTPQTPSAPVESGAGVQQPSTTGFDAQKEIAELKSQIRGMQSGKDRGISSVKKQVDGLSAILERYIPADALPAFNREVEYEEIKRRVLTDDPVQASQGSGAPKPDELVMKVVASLGLNMSDPEVTSIMRERNGADAVVALSELRVKRATSPQPTPASTPAIGGAPVLEKPLEALAADYQNEVRANRGNRAVIKGIQQKYQQKGLDTSSVTFT